MQVGSSIPFAPAQPAATPARPLTPEVTPDLQRADFSPATAPQPGSARDGNSRDGSSRNSAEAREQEQQIAELASRDREVRAHEQAHAAVGGPHAGAPTYTFQRGPDGKRYAIGGEVGIDTGPVANDPEATLRKMELVQRAALAPAEPSAQDRRVAAQAAAKATVARAELTRQRQDEAAAMAEERAARREARDDEASPVPSAELSLYRDLARSQAPEPLLDLHA